MAEFEVEMKKTSKKLHMSKEARIKCHQLLKWNKKKEQDALPQNNWRTFSGTEQIKSKVQ